MARVAIVVEFTLKAGQRAAFETEVRRQDGLLGATAMAGAGN